MQEFSNQLTQKSGGTIVQRTTLEQWGPFGIAFVPYLMAIFSSLSIGPGRQFQIDPFVVVIAIMALSCFGFVLAVQFGARSVRALKFSCIVALAACIPVFLNPELTLQSAVELALIGHLWAVISLIGKIRGFWWLRKPLEAISGIASIPELKAKQVFDQIHEEERAKADPRFALQRAKSEWVGLTNLGCESSTSDQSNKENLSCKVLTRKQPQSRLQSFWLWLIDERVD